jgi:Raf kinase inhibitor-like YbhB/YbcL family protein
MKKTAVFVAIAAIALLSACAATGTQTAPPDVTTPAAASPTPSPTPGLTPSPLPATSAPAEKKDMSVVSSGIVGGYIDPKYGMYGENVKNGVPLLSIPLEIRDAPDNTACFALYMDDPDSEPLCGYRWVHWTAADFTETSLPGGFSADAGGEAVQGTNDFGAAGYGGPTPPDKDHTYAITVYALDAKTGLKEGFTKEQFNAAIEGHVLARAEVKGIYRK